MIAGILNLINRSPQPKINTVFTNLMTKFPNCLLIHKIKKTIARLDQCHPHVKRRKHSRIFNPDHPGANDRQAARDGLHVEKFITVKNRGGVEWHPVGAKGFGSGTNQKPACSQPGAFARLGPHLKTICTGKPRQPC